MRLLLIGPHRLDARLTAAVTHLNAVVDEVTLPDEALNMLELYPYDVAIVVTDDAASAVATIRALRAHSPHQPLLCLCQAYCSRACSQCLDAGADDYLCGQVENHELQARLRALGRRLHRRPDTVLAYGPLQLDTAARLVVYSGHMLKLTAKEYGILELFFQNPGRTFTRDEIADRLWGADFTATTNIIDVYVKNLRRKIGDGYIQTIRGLGYRLAA